MFVRGVRASGREVCGAEDREFDCAAALKTEDMVLVELAEPTPLSASPRRYSCSLNVVDLLEPSTFLATL